MTGHPARRGAVMGVRARAPRPTPQAAALLAIGLCLLFLCLLGLAALAGQSR